MPTSRHMRPPKTTVALRVARMLADGWHIEPCGRVSPQSHEQRKRGPFPGLAGLPSPRASDCSSVRLPPLCSINCVRGYPSGGQLCSVKRPALAPPGMRMPCRPGIRFLLARRGFLPLPYHGRDRRQGTCLARPARSATARAASSAGSPPRAQAKTTVHWTWSCGMACEGAQTKKSPAERGQNRQSGGIEVLPLGDRAGRRAVRRRAIQKRPPRAGSGKGVSNDLWQRPTFPHDVMQYHRRWRA